MLKTKRLILRKWEESDAENLYKYASNRLVGPAAGWPPHTSVENSREIIKNVLSSPETYAIVDKRTNTAIGSIGIKIGKYSNLGIPDTEGEIGYWLGVDFWGQGLVPEAVNRIIEHGFCELKLNTIWCGYYEGNEKSKRVQEKTGFRYSHTIKDMECPLINEFKTVHISKITQEEWKKA